MYVGTQELWKLHTINILKLKYHLLTYKNQIHGYIIMLRDLRNMLTFLLFLGFLVVTFTFIIWFCFNFLLTWLCIYKHMYKCMLVMHVELHVATFS